ncbi:MAG: toll/interleukin-1 receptor domain-containing protein [Planctomycetota bacterium]
MTLSKHGPAKIFVSYAREDLNPIDWRKRIQSAVSDSAHITWWDATQLSTGSAWKPAIEGALRGADIAILLVSSRYYESEFCRAEEQLIIERSDRMKVYGIVLDGIDIRERPIGQTGSFPSSFFRAGEALSSVPTEDLPEALSEIKATIEELAEPQNRLNYTSDALVRCVPEDEHVGKKFADFLARYHGIGGSVSLHVLDDSLGEDREALVGRQAELEFFIWSESANQNEPFIGLARDCARLRYFPVTTDDVAPVVHKELQTVKIWDPRIREDDLVGQRQIESELRWIHAVDDAPQSAMGLINSWLEQSPQSEFPRKDAARTHRVALTFCLLGAASLAGSGYFLASQRPLSAFLSALAGILPLLWFWPRVSHASAMGGFVAGAGSIVAAYFVGPSEGWDRKYNRIADTVPAGWMLELIVLATLLFAAFRVHGNLFARSFRRMMTLPSPRSAEAWSLLALLLAVTTCLAVVHGYHLEDGPHALHARSQEWGLDEELVSYRMDYARYAPHSFHVFAVLAPLFLVVPMFAAFDSRSSLQQRAKRVGDTRVGFGRLCRHLYLDAAKQVECAAWIAGLLAAFLIFGASAYAKPAIAIASAVATLIIAFNLLIVGFTATAISGTEGPTKSKLLETGTIWRAAKGWKCTRILAVTASIAMVAFVTRMVM